MRIYKKFTFVFLAAALVITNAFAATDSHNKAADELLDAMNMNELLEQSIESMMQFELSNNPALLPYEETMRAFFKKYMSGDSLRDEFIAIYVETFSENELIEIADFYKTETGQKALKTAPELLAKGAAIGQQRVQENLPELQEMVKQEARRIQELQHQ